MFLVGRGCRIGLCWETLPWTLYRNLLQDMEKAMPLEQHLPIMRLAWLRHWLLGLLVSLPAKWGQWHPSCRVAEIPTSLGTEAATCIVEIHIPGGGPCPSYLVSPSLLFQHLWCQLVKRCLSVFLPLQTEHDECGSGQHNCDENAICTNTVQGHSCTCKPGYVGNGTICRGRLAAKWGARSSFPAWAPGTYVADSFYHGGSWAWPGFHSWSVIWWGHCASGKKKNALRLHFGLNADGMPLGQGHGSTIVCGLVWLCLSAWIFEGHCNCWCGFLLPVSFAQRTGGSCLWPYSRYGVPWLEASSFSLCPERFSNSEVVPWLPSAFRIKLKLLLMASENIQNLVSGSSQLVFLFALPFIPSTTNMLFPLFLRLANLIPVSGLCACCPLSLDVYLLKVSPQAFPYHRNFGWPTLK